LEEVAEKLEKILKALISSNLQSFQRKAEQLVIADSGWEHKVTLHAVDLESQLNSLAQNCKDKLLAEVAQRAVKAHEDNIKEVLHGAVEALEDNMAAKLKDGYVEQVETFNENLHEILRQGFGLDRVQVFEFLGRSEKGAYEFCIKELKNVFA